MLRIFLNKPSPNAQKTLQQRHRYRIFRRNTVLGIGGFNLVFNKIMSSTVFNTDCMKIMAKYPDGYFDLAVCDVPYGIDVGKMAFLKETKTLVRQKNGNRLNGNLSKKTHTKKDWDSYPPPQAYFDELQRVAKGQIIFGVEYLDWIGLGSGRIRWNKGVPEGVSFKGYEMAYCSLIDKEIELNLLWSGMNQAKSLSEPMVQQGNKALNEKRIHPTQKPVLLYDWIIGNFSKSGMRILDTHLGSGSSRISADKFGLDFVGVELDKEYFNLQEKRWTTYKSQLQLF